MSTIEDRLLGAKDWDRYRVSAEAGVDTVEANRYWRALGFPDQLRESATYTALDASALKLMNHMVEDGQLSQDTALGITRAMGHHMNRLALWQLEAMVEERVLDGDMPDTQARMDVLAKLPELLESFEQEALYAWKRQMSDVATRMAAEVIQTIMEAGKEQGKDQRSSSLPLHRAVGFADMVSFTRLSQTLDGQELAALVQKFESTTRDIVAMCGGRVVKTVGDEILYVSDTPQSGAEISVAITEAVSSVSLLPPVRVGFLWGPLLSRLGDVFGPTVNLAARLEALAEPGTVVTNASTAAALERSQPGGYLFSGGRRVPVRGVGDVDVVTVSRGSARSPRA